MQFFVSKKEPKVGDTRILKRFAFFPTRLEYNEFNIWVWLEFYLIHEKLDTYRTEYSVETAWTEIKRRIK